jgi:hypothetical protein
MEDGDTVNASNLIETLFLGSASCVIFIYLVVPDAIEDKWNFKDHIVRMFRPEATRLHLK